MNAGLCVIVIEGGTVVTVDDADHVYAPGHVVIEDDRITAVGPGRYQGQDGVAGTRSAEKIDAGGMVVMPGLVDLHYHTAVGKGFCDHLPLWESLEQFWYPSIRALDAETAYWAAAASYLESVKCGVTTVNDMYRRTPTTPSTARPAAGSRCTWESSGCRWPPPSYSGMPGSWPTSWTPASTCT
jgi:5-methylthioadenosine/S-adenosylhomocysteine deaminase